MNKLPDLVLNGIILNGGRSSRMGVDKGSITYHNAKQTDHLVALLSKFCDEVFISSKKADPSLLHPTIPDLFELDSPLNGILSAFSHGPSQAWLSIPIDMPFVDEKVIEYLISSRDGQALATCFFDSDGKMPEPLLAIWEPACGALLKSFYDRGNYSPRKFLQTHKANIVTCPWPLALTNINTPAELDAFQKKPSDKNLQ
jgi:molybdenum cofactor guanylyltransferase